MFVTYFICYSNYISNSLQRHIFRQSLVIHFGMFSSVCSVWFHYLMCEIVHDDPNADIDAAYACLQQDDKMKIIMEDFIEPLLQPIVIECTSIALQFLLKIWTSSTHENDSNPTVTYEEKVAPRLKLTIRAVSFILNLPIIVFAILLIWVEDNN